MDDGTQVSHKYLLEPGFIRELYLFELATTIALMQENMLDGMNSSAYNSHFKYHSSIKKNKRKREIILSQKKFREEQTE